MGDEIGFKYFVPTPEREEEFAITLMLNKDEIDRETISTLKQLFDKEEFYKKDCIDFNFSIKYYNGILDKLTAVEQLLDVGWVAWVVTAELRHAKSIIQAVLCKLEKLEQKFSEKDTP